jgi:hypothetical protein
MKPEFPMLNEKASMYVATPLLAFTTIFIISSAFTLPAKEVYPMVFSAFGITAALSGICFSLAALPIKKSKVKYAGEKFLHSSLLLIQLIAIVYVKSSSLEISFVKTNNNLKIAIVSLLSAVFILVSSVAFWIFYFGFEALNDELWNNYKKRIEKIRKRIDKNKTEEKISN